MNNKLIILLYLIMFSFCSTKITKRSDALTGDEKLINSDPMINHTSHVNICPDQGDCKVAILKNKALSIKTINNYPFYEIIEDNNKTVIQYQYSKNQDQVLYDGGYKEEIVFEIDNGIKNVELNNYELIKTKMLYGRYCNCRGSSGLFKVNTGKIILKKENDNISFELSYKTGKIPQIISYISVKNNILFFD